MLETKRFLKSIKLSKLTFFILLVVLILALVNYYFTSGGIFSSKPYLNKHPSTPLFYVDSDTSYGWKKSRQPPCNRWIVSYTTREEPTRELKILHEALFGWCLVVVGDSPTPSNWTYKDIYFLSIQDQANLSPKFELINNLPLNSYKRKLAGYLFAMSNGAKTIFETGDDIFLNEGLFPFRHETFKGLHVKSREGKLKTPAEYFSNNDSYTIYSPQNQVPVIQQGTIIENSQDIRPSSPSLVIDDYMILDSRSILWHYEGFWSMMMPIFSTESNLIRSILLCRLLKETGHQKAIVVSQIFSKSVLNFRANELGQNIVNAANEWTCQDKELKNCLVSLVQFFVGRGFLNQTDVNSFNQWIQALNSLHYKWPSIKQLKPLSSVSVNYKNFAPKTRQKQMENFLYQNCQLEISESNLPIQQLVLVSFVSSNLDWKKVAFMAGLFFEHSIICFREEDDEIRKTFSNVFGPTLVTIGNDEPRKFENCLSNAFNIGLKPQAFLIVHQNFEFWNFDFSRVEFNRIFSDLDLDQNLQQDDVYFIRKNVANGVRKVKLRRKSSQFGSICEYLEKTRNQKNAFQQLLDSIGKLNFHSNELASEFCHDLKPKTIWMPDYHDGPRVDISSTLVHLGMRPILANPKYHKSPYPEALSLSQVSYSLSQFILNYIPFARSVNLAAFRENFAFYSKLTEFEQVDAVICSFTVSLCEAYISFNKSVIFNPAHRYNIGRCSPESWKKLNQNYYTTIGKSKGIIAAMSKYDQEYQSHFTGLRGFRLYAYGGFYAKQVVYSPKFEEILVGPTSYLGSREKQWLIELNHVAKPFGYVFKHVRDVYSKYTLQDLANHKAIVIFPYASMTYSLVDFYIAKIPMFVPSIDIFTKYKTVVDRNVKFGPYCGSECVDIEAHNETIHQFSPNDDSEEHLRYWLKYSDFYQWPFVNVFSSWNELILKLDNLNLTQISQDMKWFNTLRETDLLENWCQLTKQIKKSNIPSSYDQALKYFNTSDFQI